MGGRNSRNPGAKGDLCGNGRPKEGRDNGRGKRGFVFAGDKKKTWSGLINDGRKTKNLRGQGKRSWQGKKKGKRVVDGKKEKKRQNGPDEC